MGYLHFKNQQQPLSLQPQKIKILWGFLEITKAITIQIMAPASI